MIELYHNDMSTCAKKVRLVLAEKGIEWQGHHLNLRGGDTVKPEYLKLNPNGVVPTLVDGDLVLWESSAILLYLAEKYPHGALLPTALDERARVYKWLVWQPATFNPPRQRLVAELGKPDAERDPAAIDALRATIARNLEILAEALGAGEYLLGRYTLADLVMLPHLAALHDAQFPLPGTVQRYHDRLAGRPAWRQALDWPG